MQSLIHTVEVILKAVDAILDVPYVSICIKNQVTYDLDICAMALFQPYDTREGHCRLDRQEIDYILLFSVGIWIHVTCSDLKLCRMTFNGENQDKVGRNMYVEIHWVIKMEYVEINKIRKQRAIIDEGVDIITRVLTKDTV
eukprot:619576_1